MLTALTPYACAFRAPDALGIAERHIGAMRVPGSTACEQLNSYR